MKGIFAGVVAGAVGALLWGIIAMATGYEIGWIAWGIGLAVGAGVAWGTDGGKPAGMLAVVISLLAIVGGKYIALELVMDREAKTIAAHTAERIEADEEFVISWLADMIVLGMIGEGVAVEWPGGIVPDVPEFEADYPPQVWAQAAQTWSEMSEAQKQEFRQHVQETASQNIDTMTAMYRKEGFIASFGAIDILFFFLAVLTAYKVGSKDAAG